MPRDEDDGHAKRSRLRELSHTLVVGVLRRSAPLTQAELVRETGLSRATVASIVAELRAEGRLVVQPGARGSGRGRPGTAVTLRPGAEVVIGVDFGHQHLGIALAQLDGTVLAERRQPMNVHDAAETSLDHAAELISEMVTAAGLADEPVMMGVGVPGPVEVDPEGAGGRGSSYPGGSIGAGSVGGAGGRVGRVCAGTVLPSWSGYDPAAELTARTGIAAVAENDANLGAVGEWRYGVGRGEDNLVFVKVSSGIGTGMILDGRLYRGSRGTSGEIGHVQVREDGALCRCGSRGCLETVSSSDAALALLSPAHGRSMGTSDLYELEAAGDPGVLRLLTDMGNAIGKVIAVVVANLDPDLVIVGGAMARPALVAGVATAVHRYNQPYVARDTRVVPASLGERASLMGAIAIAIDACA